MPDKSGKNFGLRYAGIQMNLPEVSIAASLHCLPSIDSPAAYVPRAVSDKHPLGTSIDDFTVRQVVSTTNGSQVRKQRTSTRSIGVARCGLMSGAISLSRLRL
ncbi:MAG TPA: hypothetical protein VMF32_21985 [Xanthobacteraceae bacterium]|nr:hypothetical protein [Xanthobacteraceae bacterium]